MPRFYPDCRVILGVLLDGYERLPDSKPLVVSATPTSATVYRNAYKQADSFSLTFNATDFPIHPGQIRTGQAQIYLFQTDGLSPEKRNVFAGRTPTIVGLFDEAGLHYNSDERTFTIEGQDFTALAIGKKWNTKRRIKGGKPLSLVLVDLLREIDPPRASAISTLTLDFRSTVDPVVGAVESHRNRKKGVKLKAKDYWSIIFDLCNRYGLISFFEGFSLVVTTPRTRFTEADARLRKMAWGRNIEDLDITRNMGKDRTPQIKVVCWDDANQKKLEGIFPTKGRPAKTGIGTDFEEVQVYTVYGIHDVETLRRSAESIYDLRARGEHKIVIRTADLKDLDDQDLLDVRAGDPLQVIFDPFNTDELKALGSSAARTQYLINHGFKPSVAAAFADNLSALVSFRKPLRVREASYDWSVDDGVELEIELQEYVSIEEPT